MNSGQQIKGKMLKECNNLIYRQFSQIKTSVLHSSLILLYSSNKYELNDKICHYLLLLTEEKNHSLRVKSLSLKKRSGPEFNLLEETMFLQK